MTFGPVFTAPFRKTFTDVSAVSWWLSGGIAAANCIAAYQPKGAASLAASYVNLVTPGTYNAAPGVAPTWDTVNGWIFNGTTQYLTTGIIPIRQVSSSIIRFSNVGSNDEPLFLVREGVSTVYGIVPMSGAGTSVLYSSGNSLGVAPGLTSGILAVAGNKGYRNGSADAGTITAGSGVFTFGIVFPARNNSGAIQIPLACNIQAFAHYSTTLTAPQILALYTAMAAL